MQAIILDIDVLYFCCFRKVTSNSLILTYLIPPFTTVRGLLANVLGYKRDDLNLQEAIKIGIIVQDFGTKNTELAKILKLKKDPKRKKSPDYPSSPMFKEYLVQPRYKVFIGGDQNIMGKIDTSLQNCSRPVYLGQSDDLIDIKKSEIMPAEQVDTDIINSSVSEFVEDSIMEKVPFKFSGDGKSLEYKIVCIPMQQKARLKTTIKAYKISDYFVELF